MFCNPPTITIDGITISTSDFENAKELLNIVSGDQGDPTLDEYTENIANGNNINNRTGVQFPESTQTTEPGPITVPGVDKNTTPPTDKDGTPVSCPLWDGLDYSIQLSTNFQLKDFTLTALYPNPLTDYDLTYTKQIRFCNLMNLAVNVAEPLLAKFGSFRINSGIRNKTSATTGISQHVVGQAFDIQFPGWNYERYWQNAAWIKDNIPYDQFIFEHSSTSGLAWYHLSYNPAGNRPSTVRTKVMTMYRNGYDPGLIKYA